MDFDSIYFNPRTVLVITVSSRKIWISAQICQRMNGVRLTTCKSAKDRTAMAVTLEAARILQREHGLPPEFFLKTLNTTRR